MSYLTNDRLQTPAQGTVELFDLLRAFGGCLELSAHGGLEHTLEEGHPRRDARWVANKVGGDLKLDTFKD